MTCTFCDYREATLLVMAMFDSVPTPVCGSCELTMVTPHLIVGEADTELV